MKKLLLFIAGVTIINYTFGQLSAVDYTSKAFAQFKGSKTYIVKMGDAAYDNSIENAVKNSWKSTSFDFINKEEFEKKISDKSASFIVPVIIGTKYPSQNYHYIALINGGRKRLSAYDYDDMLAYAPVNHWVDEPNNTDCAYRIRNIIESMSDVILIVQKNDIKGNTKNIVGDLKKYYNTKSSAIKNRTLLICEESMGKKFNKADVGSVYPYKYEICSKEKLTQIINEKSNEYYYFQPGITLNKSMFVFDPSNGEVIYFDYDVSGLYITKKNLQALASTISGKKK